MTIYTIGVYGFDTASFLAALKAARVTCVVDIRRRRGVRGSAYRFANASALQALLEVNDINYIAERRLSPTQEIRTIQRQLDAQADVRKSARAQLSPEFIEAYKSRILAAFSKIDLDELMTSVGDAPALLCVERTAAACHRHLAAEWIAADVGSAVVNLEP